MSGDQKLPVDRNAQGSGNGLSHHHIAIIVGAIVILIIAGGVFLNEAGKNPQPATEKLPADRDMLYQVSTINALVLGVYDGVQSAGDIQKHGDFGIGTFEGLDGEMIVVEGKYYQATSDGSVHIVDPSIMVPFATVTFFDNDKSIQLGGGENLTSFTNRIDKALPSKNLIYAIRVDGTFPEVNVRAIPPQKKPYPPLAEAATHQVVTKLKNTTGTVVGFYLPPYMNGVNMPGYHLHYISSDRKSGGHILDLIAPETPVTVMIDQTADFSMSTPTTGHFAETNFSVDVSQELLQVER